MTVLNKALNSFAELHLNKTPQIKLNNEPLNIFGVSTYSNSTTRVKLLFYLYLVRYYTVQN